MSERLPPRRSPAPPAKPAAASDRAIDKAAAKPPAPRPKETGGPEGPEPTRYGDWERKGRCIDF